MRKEELTINCLLNDGHALSEPPEEHLRRVYYTERLLQHTVAKTPDPLTPVAIFQAQTAATLERGISEEEIARAQMETFFTIVDKLHD